MAMDFGTLSFGSMTIDGIVYEHDVIIDRGKIRKRKKKPSKKFREQFGHTPVSVDEAIPWKCRHLVIGTGRYGSLPVMDQVKREARQRGVALLIVPTDEAIQALAAKSNDPTPSSTSRVDDLAQARAGLRTQIAEKRATRRLALFLLLGRDPSRACRPKETFER
jgi:hypothetical protein